jgi:putative transposase
VCGASGSPITKNGLQPVNATLLQRQWMKRFPGFSHGFSQAMYYTQAMSYRTIKIDWLPQAGKPWKTFTAVRMEAGRLWSWLVERHADARQVGEKWPTKAELQKEIKRQFSALHSQSAQQIVADFCEAIASAESLRKRGETYEYPHKKPRYRQVIFTNQGAKVRSGVLSLPCGTAGRLVIRLPKMVVLPGRVIEVRLHYGCVEIVCEIPDEARTGGPVIGVDLGVNTIIAATDGEKALLLSGREIKATIQLRNKRLAEITAKQAHKTKGSRRHRRLQRRKYRMLSHAQNKVRDLCHKATRKVAETFPNAKAYVGEPFNDAAQKMRRKQAQTVASTCNRKIIALLNYKLAACIEVDEHHTSQTCPVCGERSKHQRTYRCRCGFISPRDVVGSTNIRTIGMEGAMRPGCSVPNAIHWKYPSKYPGTAPGSHADTMQVAREPLREAAPL